MRQEGKDPAALRQVWEDALGKAWGAAGLAPKKYALQMPFYGDILHRLTEEIRRKSQGVTPRGGATADEYTPVEEALIREMGARAKVSDDEVRRELGQEVVARGPLNSEWVQGIARVLERRVPALGNLGLGFVRQVDAYLTRPHIREAVDDLVRPCLVGEPTVVVAHSLGTVISYRLLQAAAGALQVALYVTLGSPLGMEVVKRNVRPPRPGVPGGVGHWLNATDERDYVALISRLDRDTFADGIENLSDVHNSQQDAHSIVDYLQVTTVAKRIHSALG
jgi:hypothetical protein